MELHELQRDIQGLQSKVIAIRGEKDILKRIEKMKELQVSLEGLFYSTADMTIKMESSINSSSTDVESHNEKTDISQPKDDTPTPQT